MATFNKNDLYLDTSSKAASLMHSIIKNHPFVDGNKRTAVTTASIFLLKNGYYLRASNKELERSTLKVAAKDIELQEIAKWFKRYSTTN